MICTFSPESLVGPANVIGTEKELVLRSLTRWCLLVSSGLLVREGRLSIVFEPVRRASGILFMLNLIE